MPSMLWLEEQLQLWNKANVQLVDIQLSTVEVALEFTMPDSGFVYIVDHLQYIQFGEVRYTDPSDLLLHGGAGTTVQIMPRANHGRFYIVLYRMDWGNEENEWGQLAKESQLGATFSMVRAGVETSVRTLLHSMDEAWQQHHPGRQLQAKAYFLSFIYEWLQLQYQSSQHDESNTVSQLIQYMQQCYAQPITLKQLAELANYSVPHLCALFRETTGFSPIEYLTRIRIEISKTLLTESALTLAEVSEKSGYRDPSYFGRMFKRMVGVPPLQFKRSKQGEANLKSNMTIEGTQLSPLIIKRPMYRTIEHALGEIDISAIPKRIVALDWTMAEYLLALGIVPIGVSEANDMHNWVGLPIPIPEGIVDIGPRIKPNLEKIAQLSPDLIVGTSSLTVLHYDALQQIAPTVAYDIFTSCRQSSEYEALEYSFSHLASVLNRETIATGIQWRLEASYMDMRQYINTSRMNTKKAMIAFGFSRQEHSLMRLSNDGSLSIGVLERLGLTNAFMPGHFEPSGFTTMESNQLQVDDNTLMMYVVHRDDKKALSHFQKEATWRMLNVSAQRRHRPKPSNMIWPYGGPLSVNMLAVAATRSLTQK